MIILKYLTEKMLQIIKDHRGSFYEMNLLENEKKIVLNALNGSDRS